VETIEICGHCVSKEFAEEIESCGLIYGVKLIGDFIPKFYCQIISDNSVFDLIISEVKEGELISKALSIHRRTSKNFPRPEEIIHIIKVLSRIN